METEMNILQFTYLMPGWRYNYVTLYVTKLYFIELSYFVTFDILSFEEKQL